jgi:AbrB family looped-hinge helix DNA binding protein
MMTTIDAGGRVVIPKQIREAIGLSPGSAIDVAVRDGIIVLVPATSPMRLVEREGGVVAEPEQPLPTLTAEEVRSVLEAGRR